MTRSLFAPLLCLVLAQSCQPHPITQGTVRVLTSAGTSTLYVDDELRGELEAYEEGGVRLAPGAHVITLEHPRGGTSYAEVYVEPGMTLTISIDEDEGPDGDQELDLEPDPETPNDDEGME